ncbi:MAG: hypothetical protein M1491_07135 [Deltaproteobacteria bacterium]|nr:hypothetical protein [Deltaproteobacteria bacterium]MCL5276745.1 hypothetical protein [Deltaproteobacteria bacterium]
MCLVSLLSIVFMGLPESAQAIPSYARQTGFACDICHTVYPHLTPFGREFKMHGYVMDTAECVEVKGSTKMCGVDINRIPMVSARIVSMWSNQAGGDNGAVPRGVTTAGQGFMSFPSGYNDTETLNLIGDSSIYFGGKIAPYMGTFLEFTGINDEGGNLGLGAVDFAIAAPDTMVGGKSFIYGIRGVDDVFTGDPTNSLGMWGLTSQLMGMSTHNTLYDPNRAMVEGSEIYGMWGDFSDGGIFGTVGLYHPTGSQTAGSFVQAGIAGSGKLNTSKVDEAVRLAYFFPKYGNLYAEIGASGYFGKEGMMAPTTSTIANPNYTDNYYNVGIDLQVQYIGDENLAELFAIYQNQNDSSFYGQDMYSGTDYGTSGTSVQRSGFGLMADYYYERTYGVYVKYLDQSSSKVRDMDVNGTIIGLSWYPWENVQLMIEQALFGTYNPGLAQYGSTSLAASDFNVTSIKFEFLF